MKDDNYDIRENPPEPDKDKMREHHNFQVLLARMGEIEGRQKAKVVSVRRYWMTMAASLLFMLAAASYLLLVKPWRSADEGQLAIALPYQSLLVDNEKGDTLEYPGGARIIIPAKAFEYVNGTPVEGEVNVKLTQIKNNPEVFVKGIRMKHEKEWLESSAMVQIEGTHNGKEILISKGKSLQVELIGTTNGADDLQWDVFLHDTLKSKWAYQCKSDAKLFEQGKFGDSYEARKQLEALRNELWTAAERHHFASKEAQSLPNKPLKPELLDKNKQHFELDLVKGEFPELDAMGNLFWELADENTEGNPFEQEWGSMKLEKSQNSAFYTIVLSKQKKGQASIEYRIKAKPVIKQAEYHQAMAQYNRQKHEYEQKIAALPKLPKRDTTSTDNLAQLRERISKIEASLNNGVSTCIHRFNVSAFGIYTCAKTLSTNGFEESNSTFTDENGKKVSYQRMYAVCEGYRTVFSFDKSERISLPKAQTKFWYVPEKDNQVAASLPVKPGDSPVSLSRHLVGSIGDLEKVLVI